MKEYGQWVIRLSSGGYFTGDAYDPFPFCRDQRSAARFLTRDLAHMAIAPRFAMGVLTYSDLRFKRLYTWDT